MNARQNLRERPFNMSILKDFSHCSFTGTHFLRFSGGFHPPSPPFLTSEAEVCPKSACFIKKNQVRVWQI